MPSGNRSRRPEILTEYSSSVRKAAIQELDLQIHYRPGKMNQNADALSRSPVPGVPAKDRGVVNTLVCGDAGQELGTKQDDDPNLQVIKHYL